MSTTVEIIREARMEQVNYSNRYDGVPAEVQIGVYTFTSQKPATHGEAESINRELRELAAKAR